MASIDSGLHLEGNLIKLTQCIRILLIDDYSPFRDFLRGALEQMPAIEVVGEASDGMEAVEKTRELNPDLILLDVALPEMNGVEVVCRIKRQLPDAIILIVTGIYSWDMMKYAFLCGADGYMIKSDVEGELASAVESVLQGTRFISSTAVKYILD
jgi:DNA-binding NarL/FixJ family response regulator